MVTFEAEIVCGQNFHHVVISGDCSGLLGFDHVVTFGPEVVCGGNFHHMVNSYECK